LHPDVLHAYQALAVDERRAQFPPTIWTSAPAPSQELLQIWFTGVHCDVGGGYGQTGLSDITLSWMMGKAQALELQIDEAVLAQYAGPLDPEHALDQLHESWNVLWGFPSSRTIAPNASLSNSVEVRCQHAGDYRPRNLNQSSGTLASTYEIAPIVGAPP